MTTFNVSTSGQLQSALASARAGDTVLLAAGNYGAGAFNGLKYSGYVTVRSADPSRPATFSELDVNDSSYLRISGVHVANGSNGSSGSSVVEIGSGSHHIDLLNSDIHGSVNRGSTNPADYAGHYGILTRGSDIRLEGNYVHDVLNGITSFGGRNNKYLGNKIDYVGSDSMKFAGITYALIENNTLASHIYRGDGYHVDGIQFQGSSSNVTIRGNVQLAGTISTSQGIFMGTTPSVYNNILIEDNILYTGMQNGIYVHAGSGITVRNNTVLNVPGEIHPQSVIYVPAGSVVQDNITGGTSGKVSGSNVMLQYTDPNGAYFYNDFYKNAMEGRGVTLDDLRPITGTLATSKGAYDRLMELLSGGSAPAPEPIPEPTPAPEPTPSPSPGSGIDSDDFGGTTLSTFWTFAGPAGTGARLGASGGQKYLDLTVPNGDFNIYRTTKKAARVMQEADGDFQVEARFLSNPTVKNQAQGILVQEDHDSWIRFDTYFDGQDLRAFAAVTLNGSTVNRIQTVIAGDFAPYLRVTHKGDAWTLQHSTDGTSWKTAGSFTQKLDVNAVGPFASGLNSPFTARVDYFENTAAPIANEDASLGTGQTPVGQVPAAGPEPVLDRPGDMEFAGRTGDVVRIAHREALEIDAGAIAFGFEADRIDLRQGLVSKDATAYSGGGNHFSAWVANGTLRVRFQDEDSDAVIATGVRANTAYDVLATFDEQAVMLWVDGRLVGSRGFDMDWSANEEWLLVGGLGRESAPGAGTVSDPFDGTISDLMIFAQAGTPGDLGLL